MPSRMNRKNRKSCRKNRTASRKNNMNRKNRKNNMSRKSRKNNMSRKNRKSCRKNRRYGSRRQEGGSQSLSQGQQFASYHTNQHGGAYLTGAPVSAITDSSLSADLRSFARVDSLDASIRDASMQRDLDQVQVHAPQAGGRRKSKKSKKQRGGALTGAPLSQSNMLLSASDAAKAGTADFSNPLLKH